MVRMSAKHYFFSLALVLVLALTVKVRHQQTPQELHVN
jgi:hypothetical protein